VVVAEVMSSNPITVPTETSVAEFIDDYALQHRFSGYPVMEGGRVQGLVVTVNHVKAVPRDRRRKVTVGEIACDAEDVPVARPDDLLSDVLDRLSGCADGRAVVLDDDHLVGIVSPTDIARRMEVSDVS
jgi:CBS domain-containing protein